MTKHKFGGQLMDLAGFSAIMDKDGVKVWKNVASVSYLKGVRLELSLGFNEAFKWFEKEFSLSEW